MTTTTDKTHLRRKGKAVHVRRWGGLSGTRDVMEDEPFEAALLSCCAIKVRASEQLASELWGALTGIEWRHESGHTAEYSIAAAGDLVAAMRADGRTQPYLFWQHSSRPQVVPDWLAKPMAERGWTFTKTIGLWDPSENRHPYAERSLATPMPDRPFPELEGEVSK